MSSFVIAFVSLAFVLGAFAYVAMPAGGKMRRAAVSGLFAVILVALFFGYSDMLGRPKAAQLELLRTGVKDARVLGSYYKEGDGIFLWLQLPQAVEPRYYKLPWDEKMAQSLQQAIQQNSEQNGGGVAVDLPFERSWSKEEPKFYALPQPKLPDKPEDNPAVTIYRAPEQGA